MRKLIALTCFLAVLLIAAFFTNHPIVPGPNGSLSKSENLPKGSDYSENLKDLGSREIARTEPAESAEASGHNNSMSVTPIERVKSLTLDPLQTQDQWWELSSLVAPCLSLLDPAEQETFGVVASKNNAFGKLYCRGITKQTVIAALTSTSEWQYATPDTLNARRTAKDWLSQSRPLNFDEATQAVLADTKEPNIRAQLERFNPTPRARMTNLLVTTLLCSQANDCSLNNHWVIARCADLDYCEPNWNIYQIAQANLFPQEFSMYQQRWARLQGLRAR
jgi:hypothetical protein